ncbi:MAG: sigma 54-interacting transcriptional regulator [Deltaproteobacteria bacterium]
MIVLKSKKMEEVHRLIDRIARSRISVLVLGETGVGKELTAKAIHERSPRSNAPFVRLNCAALSESLIDAELFGHEKGAFTGATDSRAGLLEAAEGGTIFLDEVGEMPLATQVKFLRVLEEREVLRVGGREPISIDVRVVSATNRDLKAEIAAGNFREDLYFRLNGISLAVPPLRERTEEILDLARLFIEGACERDGIAVPTVTPEAQRVLERYRWPGNVRELRNAIERAVLLADGTIDVVQLPPELTDEQWPKFEDTLDPPTLDEREARDERDDRRLEEAMALYERQQLLAALIRTRGNQTEAADRLKISRRTLLRRLDEHDLRDELEARGLLRGATRVDVDMLEGGDEADDPEITHTGRGLKTKVRDFERGRILDALKASDGRLEQAAETLGISPRVLKRRIDRDFDD